MQRFACLLFLGMSLMLVPLSAPALARGPVPLEQTTTSIDRPADAGADANSAFQLTDEDRQQLQAAQDSADPELQDMRGGGLVLAILVILLIVLIVD